ncbi:sensor histidine kinase [Caldimonas brevitalea]|nr:ATP-binding protein [Caldimonas brevitalea]
MRSSTLALPSRRRSGVSTRVKIGLGFGSLALAVFLFVGWASARSARLQVTADAGLSLAEVARHLSSSLDAGMGERYREIQNIAGLEHLHRRELDPAAWRVVLEQLQQSFRHYAWIGVTDPQGVVVAATGGVLEKRDVAQRPWFVEARTRPFVGDVHDAVLLARLLPQVDNEPLRLVDVAAPIREGERMVGVLGAHLSWKWAQELREQALAPVEAARHIEVIVVNRAGEQLLGPKGGPRVPLAPATVERLTQQRHGIEPWQDGRRYLSAAHRAGPRAGYPGLGWTVLVRQPVSIATAPARHLQWRIWGYGLFGVLGFGLAGWWLAGRLAAPLRRVAREAQLQAPQHDAVGGSPQDEVTQLAYALGALVTQLRDRERELVSLNETLEHRVAERTRALEQANADLQSFTRTVSHDLKGPIGSVGSATRMALELSGPQLDTRARDLLSLSAAECDRLGVLVDELLALARVDQQALRREPLDMKALAQAAAADVLRSAAPAAVPLDLRIDDLPPIDGDPVLLRQVWHNLLSNAVKFSRRAAQPRVEVGVSSDERRHVFHVRDNGAGFDRQLADRLFDVFQRLHSQDEFPGTGVGLSIVKRIVNRHGGEVWAEGAPGQGACFYFALPRSA